MKVREFIEALEKATRPVTLAAGLAIVRDKLSPLDYSIFREFISSVCMESGVDCDDQEYWRFHDGSEIRNITPPEGEGNDQEES